MKQQGLYRLTDQVYLVGTPAIIEKDRALFRDGTEKEWLDLFIAKGEMDVVPPVPTASITVVRDIAGRHNTFTDLRRKGRYFFADEGHHWRGVEVEGFTTQPSLQVSNFRLSKTSCTHRQERSIAPFLTEVNPLDNNGFDRSSNRRNHR